MLLPYRSFYSFSLWCSSARVLCCALLSIIGEHVGNKKFSLKPPQPRLIYGRDLPASPEPGSLCFQRLCCILVMQFQTGNLSSLPGGGRELFPWAGGCSSAVEIPWIRDIPAAVPSFGLFLVLCWWMSSPTASTLEFRMGFFRSAP